MSDLEQKEDSPETIVTTEPLKEVDVKEILESTKLNKVDEELLKMEPADLSGSNVDEKVKQLYTEFSSFLETSGDITPDSGIKNVVPTPIDLLNAILGGGFACGSMSIILGVPGGGKSCLAGQLVASLQQNFPGALAAFLDSEEATTTLRLYNLGVRKPPLKPYNDITVEKVFKFLEGLCLFKEQKKIIDIPSLVIWDSIANTLSQKEREAEDINSVIGYKARVLSILIPKYVAKLARFNITLVAVNQLRDLIQIGNFVPAKEMKFMPTGKDMPGGNILKFNAFQMLNMKVKAVVDPKKLGFDGQIVEVACIKNKLFMPNVPVQIVGNFVTGFNNFWTNYNFLVETKRLTSGAWNYLVTLPSKKFRTIDADAMYKTDPAFKTAFDEAVKDAIQREIVEKNTIPI
jgi:RecA/RadA recombinase